MSQKTHIHESRHTYEGVKANRPSTAGERNRGVTNERVKLQIGMSQMTYTYESRHTYEGVKANRPSTAGESNIGVTHMNE